MLRSYFQVFVLQGIFLYIIILPVLFINKSEDTPIIWLDILGMLIWMIGFYFEAVGDAQLIRFKNNPNNKGKLLQEGLWSLTRHPNYFGEVVQWWGIGVVALAIQDGWMGLIGPITISFLILKVSGIPMLEKNMESIKNNIFIKYSMRKVSFENMLNELLKENYKYKNEINKKILEKIKFEYDDIKYLCDILYQYK